jgi:Flp pilus assembly pilin Flp
VTIIGARNKMAARPRRPIRGLSSVAKQSSVLGLYRSSLLALLREDENAQTMAEYAVILTVITASIFLAIALLATNIGADITKIANLVLP